MAEIIISIVALVVSVGVALWTYFQTGPRVRVRLIHAVIDDGSIAENPRRSYPTKIPIEIQRGTSRFDVEVARIVVENAGRTPVTVNEIAFDFGRTHPWSLRRHIIGMAPIDFRNHHTETRVRLQPFDDAAFLQDVWLAIREARKRHDRLTVRATVHVAGRRLQKRSARSKRWIVAPEQLSRRMATDFPDVVAFRAIWRLTRFRKDAHAVAMIIGRAVEQALVASPGVTPTVEDYKGIVESQVRLLDFKKWQPPLFLSSFQAADQISEEFRRYQFVERLGQPDPPTSPSPEP